MSTDDQYSNGESTQNPFDQVKRLVPLEKYFGEHLGCELRMEGVGRMVCRCPWHEEKTPSLKIDIDEGFFRCYGACDFGGSIIDAVMKNEPVIDTPLEALQWINDHFKLNLLFNSTYFREFSERVERAKKKLDEAKAEMDDPTSTVAAEARRQLEARGLRAETWEHFGLAVDKKAGRILIPILEKGGHPIAWSGRAMRDKFECPQCHQVVAAKDAFDSRDLAHMKAGHEGPAWRCEQESCLEAIRRCPYCRTDGVIPAFLAGQFPKYRDSGGFTKSKNLYNLFGARKALATQKNPKEKQPLLVMEGFGDVWACHQAGFPGAVAYNGGSMTREQADQLATLAKRLDRWVGLVPDFDNTGRLAVHKNIDSLRTVAPDLDVRVLWGVDTFPGADEGTHCKDIGELLQNHGDDTVSRVLSSRWWGADEFKIREILDGDWDRPEQINLVSRVVSEVRHTLNLDELVPLLAEKWEKQEATVRTFLHQSAGRGHNIMDSARLLATIDDARVAAKEYLQEGFVIATDWDDLNECLPGGGFRLRQLCMVLGKSGTGKTTLVANLLWQIIRRQRIHCVFFSLEQPRSQIYLTLAQVTLGVTSKEVEEMVLRDDPRLDEVDSLFRKYLTIVDNVPTDNSPTQPMTPGRIRAFIDEINLTRGDEPAKMIAIDHLGIVKAAAEEGASRSAIENDNMAVGWCMEQFFHICKESDTFFMVLHQLSKATEAGADLSDGSSASAFRGSSVAQDFCDYIITLWRPDQASGLSEEEKTARRGQYRIAIPKNRHGPNDIVVKAHFNHKHRRIIKESTQGIPDAFLPPQTAVSFEDLPTLGGADASSLPPATLDPMSAEDLFGEAPPASVEKPDWFLG